MRVVLSALSADARQAIADEWWHRAWVERGSTARYARLLDAIAAQGAPDALVEACAQARDDEARHVGLCATLAAYFAPLDRWRDVPIDATAFGPARLSAADRLLYEMVAFGCITETLNSALLLALVEVIDDPQIRPTVQALLSDEVRHGKLGWAYLTWDANRRSVAAVEPFLGQMLDASASENLRQDSTPCARWSAPHLGFLPRSQRIDGFLTCVRRVILPGFEHLGVATASAHTWLASQAWARVPAQADATMSSTEFTR